MDTDCELWSGRINASGYGRRHRGLAHRLAYEEVYGPIPEGLEIDHLCRNRSCVNVNHLEAVTREENVARGVSARTACKRGHLYAEQTPIVRANGGRACRECYNYTERARYRKGQKSV